MKRSPLRRKTPLARGKCKLKRTPLRKMSTNKRNTIRREKKFLNEYRTLFPNCQCCGRAKATDIHEIFSQGRRQAARENRCSILHLCRTCHEQLQTADKSVQLAIKYWSDPGGFDLLRYNEISPGAPVSMAEIDAVLEAKPKIL